MMQRKSFLLLAVVFTASTVSVLGQQSINVPDLQLKDLKGRQLRLSNYRGKVVLINFWATWCPPCRSEIPELIKLQSEYAGRLQVIGITYPPQKRRAVQSFAQSMGFNYPIALGTKRMKALFTKSDVLPLTVIVDADGTIRGVVEGILYPEEFEQRIKPLLKPTS